MRNKIKKEIQLITPLDELEANVKDDVLSWIDSGAELCRIQKPNIPNKHLVSYFAVIDGDYVLLVDHINAQLWLPTGGHVEIGEYPRDAVLREVQEELNISGEFLFEHPILITSTKTVGKTAGHTDVSIWYALKGNRNADISFDRSEFKSIHWFHKDEIPFERSDPEMKRFLAKLY